MILEQKTFLKQDTKTINVKQKINWTIVKLKTSNLQQTSQKVKRQAIGWEKIFIIYLYIFTIYIIQIVRLYIVYILYIYYISFLYI